MATLPLRPLLLCPAGPADILAPLVSGTPNIRYDVLVESCKQRDTKYGRPTLSIVTLESAHVNLGDKRVVARTASHDGE